VEITMKAQSATQWNDGIVQLFDPLTSLRYVRGFHCTPGSFVLLSMVYNEYVLEAEK